MKQIFFIFSLVFLFSCSRNQSSPTAATIDFDTIKESSDLLFSSLVNPPRTIILDNTNDDALIGSIQKMEIYKDRIVIMDCLIGKCLYVFSTDGQFICKIGTRGVGPGEFVTLVDFTIDRNSGDIYILDLALRCAHIYSSSSGEYLSTVDLTKVKGLYAGQIMFVDGYLYADMHTPKEFDETKYLLQKIDPSTGKTVECYYTPDEVNKGWYLPQSTLSPYFNFTGKHAVFSMDFMDDIIDLGSDELRPLISLKGKDLVSPADLQPIKEAENPVQELRKLNKIHTLTHFIEHDDWLYFETERGRSLGTVLYNKRTNEATSYRFLKDDYLCMDNTILNTQFGFATEEGICYYANPGTVPVFLDGMRNGLVTGDFDKKDELLKLDAEDANPILFYYTFKN